MLSPGSLVATGATAEIAEVVRLPVGVDEDLLPVDLVLHPGDHAVVAGTARAGVSSTLVLIAEQLRAASARTDEDVLVAAIHDGRSPLARCRQVDVSGRPDEFDEILDAAASDTRRWFVIVDQAPRVEDPSGRFAKLVHPGRPGLHVIAGGGPRTSRGARPLEPPHHPVANRDPARARPGHRR